MSLLKACVHVFKLAWIVNCVFIYPGGCGNVRNPDISHNTLSVLIFDPSSLKLSQSKCIDICMYMYACVLYVLVMCSTYGSIMPSMCVWVSVLSLIT